MLQTHLEQLPRDRNANVCWRNLKLNWITYFLSKRLWSNIAKRQFIFSLRKLPSIDAIREGLHLFFIRQILWVRSVTQTVSDVDQREISWLLLLLLILGRGGKRNKSLVTWSQRRGTQHCYLQTRYSVSMNWNRSQKGVKSLKPHEHQLKRGSQR